MTREPGSETLSAADLEALVVRALVASRTAPGNARSVARALTQAEIDGQKGHGLSRVPSYAAQAKAGKVDGFATPTASQLRPGTLMAARRRAGLSSRSLARTISALRAYFRWLEAEEIAQNRALLQLALPKVPHGIPKPLSIAKASAVMDGAAAGHGVGGNRNHGDVRRRGIVAQAALQIHGLQLLRPSGGSERRCGNRPGHRR